MQILYKRGGPVALQNRKNKMNLKTFNKWKKISLLIGEYVTFQTQINKKSDGQHIRRGILPENSYLSDAKVA